MRRDRHSRQRRRQRAAPSGGKIYHTVLETIRAEAISVIICSLSVRSSAAVDVEDAVWKARYVRCRTNGESIFDTGSSWCKLVSDGSLIV